MSGPKAGGIGILALPLIAVALPVVGAGAIIAGGIGVVASILDSDDQPSNQPSYNKKSYNNNNSYYKQRRINQKVERELARQREEENRRRLAMEAERKRKAEFAFDKQQAQSALERVNDCVTQFIQISNDSANKIYNISNKYISNNKANLAADAIGKIANISSTAKQFVSNEIKKIESNTNKINLAKQQADSIISKAETLEKEAEAIRKNNQKEQSYITKEIAKLSSLSNKNPKEAIAKTNDIHEKASKIIEKEREALFMLEQATDLRRQAEITYESIIKNSSELSKNIDFAENLALEKKKNQEKSRAINTEIKHLVERISSLDYERFIPGKFEAVFSTLEKYNKALKTNDEKVCIDLGNQIQNSLDNIYDEISEKIHLFEEEQLKAQALLNALTEELEQTDTSELSRWSAMPEEVKFIEEALSNSTKKFKNINSNGNKPEDFHSLEDDLIEATDGLRALNELARTNKIKFYERNEIKKAIIKALNSQDYDKPTYYYNEELEDGSEAELSDLTIYAHNPAETGDMRVTVNLDGKVNLEIFRYDEDGNEQEVTHQDASSCHQALINMGKELVNSGIDFTVTDWGKAKEFEDTPPSPPPSGAIVSQKENEQVVEQEKYRERMKR